MADEGREYFFDVRETTVRRAIVTANTAADARALLYEWEAQDPFGRPLCSDDGGPIMFGDLQTERFTYTNVSREAAYAPDEQVGMKSQSDGMNKERLKP